MLNWCGPAKLQSQNLEWGI